MDQDFFARESARLSESELTERLRDIHQGPGFSDERHAGIYRQIEARGVESLSLRQRHVFHKEMVPLTVERCSVRGCPDATGPDKAFCPAHQERYGDD